jgi:flagellar protein FliJ
MNKSQRLKTLAKVTDRMELGAAKVLIAHRRNLADAELKLSQLLGYREEYAVRLRAAPDGFHAAQIKSYHLFLSKLNEAVASQSEQLVCIRHAYEEKRHEWHRAQRKSAAVDKIAMRHHQHENLVAARREQQESDECAQRLLINGMSQTTKKL